MAKSPGFRRYRLSLLAAIWMACAIPCVAKSVAPNTVRVAIDCNTVINRMKGGFGACIHTMTEPLPVTGDSNEYRSWGGSAWGALPKADDDSAWNQVFLLTDWLGLDWVRLEINHRMYEPQKGKLVTDGEEMKILIRVLDYCQRRGIDVLLQEMWPDVEWLAYPEFKSDRIALLRSAPADINAWADGYARLVAHLVKEKNYTCIKWLSVANEPMEDWSWWRLPGNKSQSITPVIIAMKKRLHDKGLNVGIAAPDGSYSQMIRPPGEADYCRYADAISFHDYITTFDWWDKPFKYELLRMSRTAKLFDNWKHYARSAGDKPLFMAEFGTFMLGFDKDGKGPSEYTALLRDIQQVIRLSNVGVDAFSHWSLLNRGDLDGQWQLINTWDRTEKKMLTKFYPQPNSYFIYGLLTRFTAKNSDVLRTTVEGGDIDGLNRVFAVAYRSPKSGQYSILITNDSPQPFIAQIVLAGLDANARPFSRYQITEQQKDHEHVTLAPTHVIQPSNLASEAIELPARSIVLYTTYAIENQAAGIIVD